MINFLKNNIYNLFYGYFRVKICWDLYLKIDTIHTDFHEYPFQVSKLSNIYPHLKFTLPGHNAPSPSHIPIKLATPNAKIHLPRSHNHPHATIPLVAPPNNRHVCGNKETLQTFAPTLPQYLFGKQTRDKNLRRMTRWGNGQRWSISSQSRPRIILAAIFHPDCRPIALPIRDLSHAVQRCGFVWFFFFIQTATYRIDWISRDEKKDGINLGDFKLNFSRTRF